MTPKDRQQIGHIVSGILLGLIVCAGIFLAVFLYLSPSLQ
jgi:hypothetical protein